MIFPLVTFYYIENRLKNKENRRKRKLVNDIKMRFEKVHFSDLQHLSKKLIFSEFFSFIMERAFRHITGFGSFFLRQFLAFPCLMNLIEIIR